MKMKKRIAALMMILILAAAFSSCGSKGTEGEDGNTNTDANADDSEKPVDINVAALIEQAAQNIENADGLELTYVMNTDFEAEGGRINMNIDMDFSVTQDPFSMKFVTRTIMGGTTDQSTSVDVYAVENGDMYTLYFGMDGEWMVETITKEEMESDMVNDAGDVSSFDEYKDLMSGFEASEQVIDGKDMIVLSGFLDKESTEQLVVESGVLTQTGVLEIDPILEKLTQAEMQVEIEKETSNLHRMYIDITDVMETLINALIEDDIVDDEAGSFVIYNHYIEEIYKNIGNVEEIVIPEEALAAGQAAE